MMISKPPSARQPIFNIPGVVLAFLVVLITVHLWREWGMSSAGQLRFIYEYGFIPARWSVAFLSNGADAVMEALPDINSPGSQWQRFLAEQIIRDQRMGLGTAFTHALLHGSWTHLLFNSLWLVAFGAPLARRWGTASFILFCAVSALAGALVCYLAQPYSTIPTIGASGIVSAMFGASPWYAFERGANFTQREMRQLRFTFFEMLHNKTAVIFVLFWFFTVYVSAAMPEAFTGEDVRIAWEVHTGGFLAGFFLFPIIDDRIPKA